MKPSNELFLLIKSMTKAEKIYFKKFSKRHVIGDSNKYVKLFGEIEKQKKEYDENTVKENFKGDRFVNQIHVAKNYLFNLILNSLAEQSSAKDEEFIQLDSLKKIKILMDKGLAKSSKKLLDKTKNETIGFERFYMIIKLLEYERRWEMYLNLGKGTINKIEQIYLERKELIKKLSELFEYRSLYEKGFYYYLKLVNTRGRKDTEDLEKLLRAPALENENLNTFYSLQYLYKLKTMHAQSAKDDNLYYVYSKKAIDVFEKYPAFKKDLILYHSALYDSLIHTLVTYNLSEFDTYYKKFSDVVNMLKKGNKRHQALAFHSGCMVDIRYNGLILNREKVTAHTEKLKKEISFHSSNFNLRQIMDINSAASIALFRTEQYEKSLYFINMILNEHGSFKIQEIYNMALLLSLFIHYELGNTDLIEYTSQNIKKYLKDKRKLFETEDLLINFFNKICKVTENDDFQFEYTKLRHAIVRLKSKRYEKDIIDELNVIGWIDKKTVINTHPCS